MKECPNCKELLGDNVTVCFKCFFDFNENRKITTEERRERRKIEEEGREDRLKALQIQRLEAIEEQKRKEAELEEIIQEKNFAKTLRDEEIIPLNDTYQYDVVKLRDCFNGDTSVVSMKKILNSYAEKGWRLVSVHTNELGHDISSIGIGGISVGKNSTIENTIMIFERCIHRMSGYER